MKNKIFLIDFDGTCLTHSFPELGKDIGAVPVLKELVANGHQLILTTMRCDNQKEQIIGDYLLHGGDFLTQAVDWFKGNDIPLYGIQTNPTQHTWTTSPKAYGHVIIDDISLGIPIKFDPEISDRKFVDWIGVRELLIKEGILK